MTGTDTAFTTRFPTMEATAFVANQSTLADWKPTSSAINTGMLSDIGRAYIYAPDVQENFYARFMQAPLSRGDSIMSARFSEVTSRVYDPKAGDEALFNGDYATMISNVAKKNFSRQIATEVNDYVLRQFVQTQDMIGDAMAAIMARTNACYKDDMWVASKEYFSGSTRNAKTDQLHILSNPVSEADNKFAKEMTQLLWKISQNQFQYKSAKYNPAGYNTKSNSVSIALKKDVEFPTFHTLLSETFNPGLLKIQSTIDYVDDFATPAGAPVDAGELIGMVVDNRAFKITPMPDTMTTEAFRNPARKSTAYFTTYEYAFQQDPFFNVAYIFAPKE